ncbi:WYL domain-containing protein [Marinicella sp. S1101]|uniref:helix-turn-helix transcriptional regulator n=1 Tax=Marinicella marina TaxID=2996016 RepID=UPI002260F069|nr:WYL domain-containing protein [Marinicella marina]MCX7553791.1 WYL domain-containing protein [Marinicella marina]MDJ1140866.1 WYL domain-containing protein [Marinicella marina]
MKKIERIYLLDSILKQRRSPISVDALKERLECSQATVYRIIATMRDEFNAPIETNEQGVFYPRDAAFDLPGIRLSAEETQGLLMAAHLLEDLQSDSLQKPMQRIIENIDKVLSQKGIANRRLIQIIPALSRQPKAAVFQAIMSALQADKKLKISYKTRGKNEITERLVSPQRLTSYRNAWYLDAWCHLREDIRLFALEQIQAISPDIEQSKKLSPEQLRSHYADSYGIFSGQMKSTAVIKINTTQAPWTVFEHWHSKQQMSRIDDEHMLLKIPYNDPRELIADVMRLGTAAQITEPPQLQQLITQELKNVLAQYQN